MFQHKPPVYKAANIFKPTAYDTPLKIGRPSSSFEAAAMPYSDAPLSSGLKFAQIQAAEANATVGSSLALPLPQGLTLLSKADVFTPDGSTLLMKAGQQVDGTLLARLICFGIRPEHFTLASSTGKSLGEQETQTLSKTLNAYWQRFDTVVEGQHRAYKKVDEAYTTQPLTFNPRTTVKKKTDIVIFGQNAESTQKAVSVLKRNGVALHNIHTVTDLTMLKLCIESFDPHTVIVDFIQGDDVPHGAALLCQLKADWPELNLILMLMWRSKSLHPALNYWLKRLAHIEADVLYKPLQLKTLGDIMKKKKLLPER